ncbi:MAG: hypothetical protein GX601_08210 [Anaerolineales bacterium]|nr:hypothetical protein [Anaerolineales bacterium]
MEETKWRRFTVELISAEEYQTTLADLDRLVHEYLTSLLKEQAPSDGGRKRKAADGGRG